MAGRKTSGPALVTHLDGSPCAKERLELILATISGQITVVAAAAQLGISEAMFYKLRSRVLQVSLEDLEPKPIGRPPRSDRDSAEEQALTHKVEELERELQAQTIRLELAQTIPQVLEKRAPATTQKKRSLTRDNSRTRRRRRKHHT